MANPVATERTAIVLFTGMTGNRSHSARLLCNRLPITEASQIRTIVDPRHQGMVDARELQNLGKCTSGNIR